MVRLADAQSARRHHGVFAVGFGELIVIAILA
jgi:hypothetical protein